MRESRIDAKHFASKFFAYPAAPNQMMPPLVFTQVRFDVESFDLLGEYDAAAAYTFTPISAGYYLLGASIRWSNVPAGITLQTILRINPLIQTFADYDITTALGSYIQQITALRYMTPAMNADVAVQPSGAANRQVDSVGGVTHFWAMRVG